MVEAQLLFQFGRPLWHVKKIEKRGSTALVWKGYQMPYGNVVRVGGGCGPPYLNGP
jgi:hypothetical protein